MNEWQEYIKACDAWYEHIYNTDPPCQLCWNFRRSECMEAREILAHRETTMNQWLKEGE